MILKFFLFQNQRTTFNSKIVFMGMEDETRAFLIRIMQTISIVLLWMLINVYIGIYKDYAFFEQRPNWTNYLFYVFFLGTLLLLIWHLRRKWKL